jgi:hypothetical protein
MGSAEPLTAPRSAIADWLPKDGADSTASTADPFFVRADARLGACDEREDPGIAAPGPACAISI